MHKTITPKILYFGTPAAAIEVKIQRVHIAESLLNEEKRHYIDADR